MPLQGILLDRQNFSCLICLDLLKNPVTLDCGHSYCMSCIQANWDNEGQGEIYSCPQCQETFTPRPLLGKNIMLADLVEELKKTELQHAPAGHCYAGPEDVACDICIGTKRKAVMSCLVCLSSYCEKHLWPHLQSPAFMKHELVQPNNKLQENICSQHNEVMKMFCRTDQQCICYLCSVDGHKDHDTVSAAAERAEMQRELELGRQMIHLRIQDRQRDAELLRQEAEALDRSSEKAAENNDKVFAEVICLLRQRSSQVKQRIRSQQEAEASRVKELQERLEQETTALKRNVHQLQQLLDTDDHLQFLQNCPALSLSEYTHSFRIRPLGNYGDMTAAVSQVRCLIEDFLTETDTKPLQSLFRVNALLPTTPKTRADFLKYSQDIILDPNTANKRLLLCEGNKRVTLTSEDQSYPDHPHRFIHLPQVLSRDSLAGRCYWEVESSGTTIVEAGVCVAVAYKDVMTAGGSYNYGFGFNDISWGLFCHINSFNFYHNKIRTSVSGPLSSRIGVYLDQTAGVLSFYSVSNTMTLLHRVEATFTQPLYAGIRVLFLGSTAEFK